MYTLNQKIAELIPYQPIVGNYPIRLDANESCYNLPEDMLNQIKNAVDTTAFNRYPDPYATDLCKAFADYYGINPENVTAFNGSDELIMILTSTFLMSGETMVTVEPDFSMYRFYASLCEVNTVSAPKNNDLSVNIDTVIETVNQHNARAVIFSNPCNPTSKGISKDNILKLVNSVENCLVILDEAYMDFWECSLLDIINDFDNLLIMRTASKAVGMASVRLGFAVANQKITNTLRAVKSPYNVNTVSQTIGTIIYSNKEFLQNRRNTLVSLRKTLYNDLKQLENLYPDKLKIVSGSSNFVFVKTDFGKAIFDFLLNKGVAIRYMGDYIRITAGTQQENTTVVNLLKEFFTQEV